MKLRKVIAGAGALCALAAGAPAAQAITNGAPDEGRHPWVGALVSYDPATGDKYLICSGVLISRQVFLTAAHCLEDEPSDLYVSFDDFVGAPDVGPDVTLHHGQAYADPGYEGNTTGPGDTHDLAVVVLDEALPRGTRTGRLAPKGTLTKLRRAAHKLRWGVAGYGREGYDPVEDAFYGGGSRHFGYGSWLSLDSHTFMLSQDSDDEAGTCNGDSGGPIFLGRTRTVVGVSSDGDELCQENSINVRTDTKSALSFLGPILRGDLPEREQEVAEAETEAVEAEPLDAEGVAAE